MDTQEELKADLLANVYKDHLGVGALGMGPADLVKGTEKLRLPRTVANLGGEIDMKGLLLSNVVTVGGAKVGVFGVIAPGAVKGIEVTDPVAAGKHAVAEVKKQGAQIVIALVQAPSKRDAVAIARDIGG